MRILIAEDNRELRELLAEFLIRKEHTVIATPDGEAALRVFTEDGPFDYVITDYQMPRTNGIVLIMNIRRAKPDQKVILVSGDTPTITANIRKVVGEFPFLRKPYSNADLLALLT